LDHIKREHEDDINDADHKGQGITGDIDKIDKAKKNIERQLLTLKEDLTRQDEDNQNLKRVSKPM